MTPAPIVYGHTPNPLGEDKPTWRIYFWTPTKPDFYDTYDSLDGEPEDSPVNSKDTVIAIVHCMPNGLRNPLIAADVYGVDLEGKWTPTNEEGIKIYEREGVPLQNIHRGLNGTHKGFWINQERFEYIVNIASNDPDFPNRFGDMYEGIGK